MGFLKGLGTGLGSIVGGVTGGVIKGVGEITGSKFIEEVGDGVKHSTKFAGEQLGNLAEGVWNVGSGIVTKNDEKIDQGVGDIGEGIGKTAKAVGEGVKSTVKNVGNVAGGIKDGDSTRLKQGLRDVGKTVAIGALGLSILDVADVIDVNGNEGGFDGTDHAPDHVAEENPNDHFVHPYERTLANGDTIWVDGDGDTSVNLEANQGGGWNQSNPDYRLPVDKD